MSTATSSLGPKVLALATLALAGFAYGKPAPEVWWWVVFLGSALAVATLVSAWQVKGARLAEPFTARVGSFVVAEIVLPVLALFAAVGAMIAGGGVMFDVAIIFAVTLAIVSFF